MLENAGEFRVSLLLHVSINRIAQRKLILWICTMWCLAMTSNTLLATAATAAAAVAPVATVIPTPTILRASDNLIYMTGSSKLVINGTNFREKVTTTTTTTTTATKGEMRSTVFSLSHALCQQPCQTRPLRTHFFFCLSETTLPIFACGPHTRITYAHAHELHLIEESITHSCNN